MKTKSPIFLSPDSCIVSRINNAAIDTMVATQWLNYDIKLK